MSLAREAFEKVAGLDQAVAKAQKTPGHHAKPLNEAPRSKSASLTVEQMQSNFINNATRAIMSEVAADVYQDPILSRIAETGDLKTVAKLAEGRYMGAAEAQKIAAMDPKEFQDLATEGLRKKALKAVS